MENYPLIIIRKLLELIKFSTVAGYKANIQKSVVCLLTCNEQSENEIEQTVLFTIASEPMKYLGRNLAK